MAKITKKDYSEDYNDMYGSNTSYKPDLFLDCGEAFKDASGLPGPAMGHVNMLLGHSNSGKTSSLIASAVDAQKKGILPIFIVTEKKWSFDHCKLMGFSAEKDIATNKWKGDFVYRDDFYYVEQITDFINKVLDDQEKGKLKRDICFFWDSVGSVPCKMTYEGKGGKQHTAGVYAEKINMGINQRINNTRKSDSPYWAGLVVCNLPWVQRPTSPMGQPKIKPKGGEAFYQCSTLVFRFGNESESGISKIDATKNGRTINIAVRSKITVDKNHINGLGYKDSNIIITPHGFLKSDKRSGKTIAEGKSVLDKYKKDHMDYIAGLLGVSVDDLSNDDIEISETEESPEGVEYEDD